MFFKTYRPVSNSWSHPSETNVIIGLKGHMVLTGNIYQGIDFNFIHETGHCKKEHRSQRHASNEDDFIFDFWFPYCSLHSYRTPYENVMKQWLSEKHDRQAKFFFQQLLFNNEGIFATTANQALLDYEITFHFIKC